MQIRFKTAISTSNGAIDISKPVEWPDHEAQNFIDAGMAEAVEVTVPAAPAPSPEPEQPVVAEVVAEEAPPAPASAPDHTEPTADVAPSPEQQQ
jgi:hypothetical protein